MELNTTENYLFRGAMELEVNGYSDICWVVWLDDHIIINEYKDSDGYRSYYNDPDIVGVDKLTEQQQQQFPMKNEPLLVKMIDGALLEKKIDSVYTPDFNGFGFVPSTDYWKDELILVSYVGTNNYDDYYPCATAVNLVENIDKAFKKQMEVLLEDTIWGDK